MLFVSLANKQTTKREECRVKLCVAGRIIVLKMSKYSTLPEYGQVSIYMDDNERRGKARMNGF